jgi:hypothetical protein
MDIRSISANRLTREQITSFERRLARVSEALSHKGDNGHPPLFRFRYWFVNLDAKQVPFIELDARMFAVRGEAGLVRK